MTQLTSVILNPLYYGPKSQKETFSSSQIKETSNLILSFFHTVGKVKLKKRNHDRTKDGTHFSNVTY